MKGKNKTVKQFTKRILQLIYFLVKPFLPFIILFLFIFFFIILIIDAIFIDKGDFNFDEKELQTYCESLSSSSYEVYVDGEKTNEKIDISSNETAKAITWEQIYSLMIFHNISDNKEVNNELAKQIANDFKSKYYYKTSKIITEKKITDDEGNVTWEQTNVETVKLITESITIAGHYKYNYEEVIEEDEEQRVTKEVLKTTILQDEEYSLLKNYLKEHLGVSEDDLELDAQIVIQSAKGLKNGTDNIEWLSENQINYNNFSNYGTKWPLPGYTKLSSNYGYRTHPITRSKG